MHNNTPDNKRQDMTVRYRVARKITERVSTLYRMNGDERRADRMYNCGRIIMAGRCPCCNKTQSIRLERACGSRMCALCAMRKSRVIAAQALEAMEWIDANKKEDYKPYLVTLTQKNVQRGSLAAEIDRLITACAKMRYRRVIRNSLMGAARTLEITYNKTAKTWHPHVHLIALVKADDVASKKLHQAGTWASLWADLADITDYVPIVDVREINDSKGAVYEVSKYVTKHGELIKGLGDVEAAAVIRELHGAIYGRVLQAWMGIWREARKALAQLDVERMTSGQLDEKASSCPDCGGALIDALMRWNGMEYCIYPQDGK